MLADITIRYLHFISLLTLTASIAGELFLYRPVMTRRELRRLLNLDALYGVSAIAVLATGLLQWFVVGKPADFYSSNPIFHTKFTLFAVLGIVSIYPTVYFARRKKGNPDDTIELPAMLKRTIQAELALLALMPLLASLMARGVGN